MRCDVLYKLKRSFILSHQLNDGTRRTLGELEALVRNLIGLVDGILRFRTFVCWSVKSV